MDLANLITTKDIGRRSGISFYRLKAFMSDNTFPDSKITLSGIDYWDARQVDDWFKEHHPIKPKTRPRPITKDRMPTTVEVSESQKDIPIEDAPISTQAKNALKRRGAASLGDLHGTAWKDLYLEAGFSQKSGCIPLKHVTEFPIFSS